MFQAALFTTVVFASGGAAYEGYMLAAKLWNFLILSMLYMIMFLYQGFMWLLRELTS